MALGVIERDTLRFAVKAAVRSVLDKAEALYGDMFETPEILFTKKGRVAGAAHSGSWLINFNEVLLQENIEEFIRNTVPHEVAHLVAYRIHGARQRHRS